jgi:hypothetical protein
LPATLFFPNRRRLLVWRKKLAALLSIRYGLGPGGLGTLLEDDERFAWYSQRFLADHQIPFPVPLYDSAGRYVHAAPEKIGILAKALTRSVAKCRDNELFVLLIDLMELEEQLTPLVAAVRMALARHHRVVLLCPWPAGIPMSGVQSPGAEPPRTSELSAEVQRATLARCRRSYRAVRQTFGRLGATVISAESSESARLVLQRMEMLRNLRCKR